MKQDARTLGREALTDLRRRGVSSVQDGHTPDEVADTLIYLVELADVLDIDLIAAARDKIVKNAIKYPAPR